MHEQLENVCQTVAFAAGFDALSALKFVAIADPGTVSS